MPAKLRNVLTYLVFPLILAVAVFVGAFFYFKPGAGYTAPPPPNFPFEALTVTRAADGPSGFVDQPPANPRRGIVAVDAAHRNGFREVELTALLSRITNRGHAVEFLGDFRPASAAGSPLGEGLSRADGLIIIGPRDTYSASEIAAVQEFVEQGGRVLLVADPTRSHQVNSIAAPLGLEFQPDYLYSQDDYDINFQHIVVREFQPDPLTVGLNAVILYTAGSIKTAGSPLASPGAATQSSLLADLSDVAPIATGENRNVVALSDLTVLVPPHNSFVDNDQLVSNLADFLTGGQRQFTLADFPYFFKQDVEILLGEPSLIDTGTALKSALADMQVPSRLAQREDPAVDTIFLGFYDNAGRVSSYLQANGIVVNDALSVPSAPEISTDDSGVITLHRSGDRSVLVALAQTEETLSTIVEYLIQDKFRDGLVNENVGVYKE